MGDEKGKPAGFSFRRYGWAVVVGVILLAGVAAMAVFWLPGRLRPPIPAADILEHANQVWGTIGQNGGVVYEKFYMMIDNALLPYAATTEVWRSADGTQVRYQITDLQGRLIYFMLRNGDKVWESGSLASLANQAPTPVTAVLPETLSQYQQELAAGQGGSIMIETAAGVDRLPTGGPACTDLKCLLGDWTLEKGVSLSRGKDTTDESGNPAAIITVNYAWAPASGNGTASFIVVVDLDTFVMQEYIDPSANMLHVEDYRSLPADGVPADLFTSFPAGVNTVG